MNQHSDLEDYREYLRLLGRSQVDQKFRSKVDLSGVIQVTLVEANLSGWSDVPNGERCQWLRKIFTNNLLDEIRKFKTLGRDVDRERSLQQSMEQSASRLEGFLIVDQSSPSHKVSRVDEAIRLTKAIASLPEPQREAIEMHHLQGMSLDLVSQRMERSKGAVAALIFRGTSKLRQLLNTEKDH